ncbi:MAG: hypothetical protein J0L92_25120 [Deltaproteobacteria bacterium]|nr:hypothetical protein [Deltaproteobacteria bacterium]
MSRREMSFACSTFAFAALGALGCEQTPIAESPDAFRMTRDAALDAFVPDAGPPPTCPPPGPFGPNVGDRIGDITLYDCAGTPVQLHSLCETDVVWLWELAEWCSPCRRFADGEFDEINSRYESMYGDRFTGIAIITADDELNLPNQTICEELRERYQIEGALYFDPTNTFRDLVGEGFSNDVHAILTRGLEIRWTMQFGSEFVDEQLRQTFEALDSGADVPDANVDLDAGPLEDVSLGADAPSSDDAGG